MKEGNFNPKLERWRAERLWARAAQLEAEERARLPAPAEERAAAVAAIGDGVDLDAAVSAGIETGMAPAAVARAARLELVLGHLDDSRPSAFEAASARVCAVPAPPLSAAGRAPVPAKELLAAFEVLSGSEQYALRFVDRAVLPGGAELRVYEILASYGYEQRPFRDRLRFYAGIKRVAVVAEDDGAGGSRFEVLADTRRSARTYGRGVVGGGLAAGLLCGWLAQLALPLLAVTLPAGILAATGLCAAINRAFSRWAFPAARRELAAFARALALRSGGEAEE